MPKAATPVAEVLPGKILPSDVGTSVVEMQKKVKVELIMAVYVDDIVIAGSDEACRDFHAALNTKFPTNNLGDST